MTDREQKLQELANQQKATGKRMNESDTSGSQTTQSEQTPATDDAGPPDDDVDDEPDPTPEPSAADHDQTLGDLLDDAIADDVSGHLTAHNKKIAPIFVALEQDVPAANDAQRDLVMWLAGELDTDPSKFKTGDEFSRSKVLDGLIRVALHQADADGIPLMSEAHRAQTRKVRNEAVEDM